MSSLDYVVLAVYLAGTLGLGIFFYFRNKTSEDMFSAGGQSPWWVSGLSSFMTVFSAATFVVWGGNRLQVWSRSSLHQHVLRDRVIGGGLFCRE